MSYEMGEVQIRLKGRSPGCMMNNVQRADPLNDYALRLKPLTGKTRKTDEDFKEIMRLEWESSFYLNQEGRVAWPGQNIRKMLVTAARQTKMGKAFERAVFVRDFAVLEYPGYEEITDPLKELWAEGGLHVDTRICVVQGKNRVPRTRPIFPQWELGFSVLHHMDQVESAHVVHALEYASDFVGLSEYRPERGGEFGRFHITKCVIKQKSKVKDVTESVM